MSYSEQPLFSVIMPAFNAAEYLARAIESVIAQEFREWQLIVVDDGSADKTRAIAEAYSHADERIVVVGQKNGGTANARNAAIAIARGKWCLMLDADDMLKPECMSTYADFFDANPGLKFASCYVTRLDPAGRFERHVHHRGDDVPESATVRNMLREVTIVLPGTCVQTALLREVGGFSVDSYTEDVELWFNLLLAGHTHRFCAEELAVWRITRGSKSSQCVAFAEGWVRMLENLDSARIGQLGLQDDLQRAIRRATSYLRMARLQAMVLSGHDGRFSYVWGFRTEIEWTPANTARVLAAVSFPGTYGRWLRRGGRRQDGLPGQ